MGGAISKRDRVSFWTAPLTAKPCTRLTKDATRTPDPFLTANKGKVVGTFTSNFTPAFANYIGYFVTGYGSTLEAAEIPSMRQSWSATLSGDTYVTPPLIVGDTVYIETASGELFGYASKTGKQEVQMNLGSYGNYRGLSVGLGYGSHELIVPDGSELIAVKGT